MLPRVNGKINPILLEKEKTLKSKQSKSVIETQVKSVKVVKGESIIKGNGSSLKVPKGITGKPVVKKISASSVNDITQKHKGLASSKYSKKRKLIDNPAASITKSKIVKSDNLALDKAVKEKSVNITKAIGDFSFSGQSQEVSVHPITPVFKSSGKSGKKKYKSNLK
jgi:hypothetical protein